MYEFVGRHKHRRHRHCFRCFAGKGVRRYRSKPAAFYAPQPSPLLSLCFVSVIVVAAAVVVVAAFMRKCSSVLVFGNI